MKEIAATKKFYNEHGQPWVDLKTNSFYNEEAFTKLAKLLPARGTVLDIGCAAGIHVPLFLGIGRHLRYVGIDISRYFIKIAKRRYPQLTFIEANIADGEFQTSQKCVGFFSGSTIQHIPLNLWPQTFSNIESMMRPKAFGFISLPIDHPKDPNDKTDTRHFTIMAEDAHLTFFKSRGYKIRYKGTHNGFAKADIWRWYIVELP